MFHAKKATLHLFMAITLLGLLLIPSSAHADPLSPPDFQLTRNWHPIRGFVVRGQTPPPAFEAWPVFPLEAFGCLYDDAHIFADSFFGFTGTIALDYTNLPSGVTSTTAPSITITGPTVISPATRLGLQADSTAALGTSTVTLRGTSGSIVHTLDIVIEVVDALPTCVGEIPGSQPPGPDSVTISKAELKGGKLKVEANECCQFDDIPTLMMWVVDAGTGATIGAMDNEGDGEFKGEFNGVSSNVTQIKVISSPAGGWEQASVN